MESVSQALLQYFQVYNTVSKLVVMKEQYLAWECRGVSAENWKLARGPGLKGGLATR